MFNIFYEDKLINIFFVYVTLLGKKAFLFFISGKQSIVLIMKTVRKATILITDQYPFRIPLHKHSQRNCSLSTLNISSSST